jgi:hypothetical protein
MFFAELKNEMKEKLLRACAGFNLDDAIAERNTFKDGWQDVISRLPSKLAFVKGLGAAEIFPRAFSKNPFDAKYCVINNKPHSSKRMRLCPNDNDPMIVPQFQCTGGNDLDIDEIVSRIFKVETVEQGKTRMNALTRSLEVLIKYPSNARPPPINLLQKLNNKEDVFLLSLSTHILKPLTAVTNEFVLNKATMKAANDVRAKCVLCENAACTKADVLPDGGHDLILGYKYLAHGIPDGVIGLSPQKTEDGVTFIVGQSTQHETVDDNMSDGSDDQSIDSGSYIEAKKCNNCEDKPGLALHEDLRQLITTVLTSSLYNDQGEKNQYSIHQGLLVTPLGYRFVWYISSIDVLLVTHKQIDWNTEGALFMMWLILNRRYLLDSKKIVTSLSAYLLQEHDNFDLTFGFKAYRDDVLANPVMKDYFKKICWDQKSIWESTPVSELMPLRFALVKRV